jgi:hypothetical protein
LRGQEGGEQGKQKRATKHITEEDSTRGN